MATATQGPPMRTKTTIFKETLPANERAATDAQPSEFYRGEWETVLQKLTPEMWETHLLRVYRADEKWDRESSPVDNKFKFAPTEEDLRKRFGGGRFLLWLYGPPKEQNLVARWRVPLEGDPIVNSVPRNGTDGSSSVAIEAMRMYSNPEFQRMQMEMMRSTMLTMIDMLKTQVPAAQNPLETLRTAKEILGVGTSPEHGLLDTIRVLKELGVVGSPEKKGVEEILSLITTLKTSGLIQSGAPKADLAATFANNLPMLVDRMVSGLHEFRLRAEAEERAIAMQRGHAAGRPDVIDVAPTPATAAAASPASAAAAPSAAPAESTTVSPEVAQAIIAQSHLHRLVQGIKNPKSTGQDMYDYLRNAWPEILDELVKFSKDQLLAFFKSRETQLQYFGSDMLTQVADEPRLPGIIEEFLKIAKENAELEKAATPSNGVV